MAKLITVLAGDDTLGLAGIQVDETVCKAYNQQAKLIVSAYSNQAQTEFTVTENKLTANDLQSIAQANILKIGQLPSFQCVNQVLAQCTQSRLDPPIIILDPVIQSSSGSKLIVDQDISNWIKAVVQNFLAITTLVTLNHFELHTLAGQHQAASVQSSINILAQSSTDIYFLVKGADINRHTNIIHMLYHNAKLIMQWQVIRQPGEFRGTGCLLASSIACELNRSNPANTRANTSSPYSATNMIESITNALNFTQQSIAAAVPIKANTYQPVVSKPIADYAAANQQIETKNVKLIGVIHET